MRRENCNCTRESKVRLQNPWRSLEMVDQCSILASRAQILDGLNVGAICCLHVVVKEVEFPESHLQNSLFQFVFVLC
uniref:Uncharacterized protein n=1 Tax=Ditylenchus dipsaci TaxID=166011 RepID=A0A915E771_9BILA